MTKNDNSFSESGQRLALAWMTRYLRAPAKASDIREAEDATTDGPQAGRRAHRLQSSCLRNLRLYREMLAPFVAKKPSKEIEAALLLALAETDTDTSGRMPAIIDSWVGVARRIGGRGASGFANAVLRKASANLQRARDGLLDLPPAVLYSHPDWMVRHWEATLGTTETRRILRWNQQTPALYASGLLDSEVMDGLEKTRWPGFYRLPHGIPESLHPLLASGRLTIRDPATRIATEMLAAARPETVLDLCASPGGKSRALLDRPNPPKMVIAADRSERLDDLRRNLSPWADSATVREIDLDRAETLPGEWQRKFDAVLLDAPCSNTGVIQRKPDVKWRLTPEDLQRMPATQKAFLRVASQFVRPGGTLVYSTCSIEPEENREVADDFLASPEGAGFEMTAAIRALPTKTGHDGAGVYRFLRSEDR